MSYIWNEWDLKPQYGDDALKRADICRLLIDYFLDYNKKLKDAEEERGYPFANDTQKLLTTKDNIDDLRWYVERMPPMVRAVNVKPVVRGANIATEYAECDQFICSKCGIHLQDWNLIEDDYEDGIVHEFVFNFCPNCGVNIRQGKDKSEDEDE